MPQSEMVWRMPDMKKEMRMRPWRSMRVCFGRCRDLAARLDRLSNVAWRY